MKMPNAWWQNKVVYQIYPRSFQDTNGDGVGDLQGIIKRLPYLSELGVDILWLSPIYRSPQDDNGYDISDYEQIDPMFGSMKDMDELIAAANSFGMKIVMDLVVNHSSDEHAWFQESRRSSNNPKADWYIWRPAKPDGSPPNNWGSFFSGSAWQWDEQRGEYYLHLFSKKQPDLNWENPEVRSEIYRMMNRWMDRGIAGFRMDVISFISKQPGLPDAKVWPGAQFGDGAEHSLNGPRLMEFLREMHREVFANRTETFTVGEWPGFNPAIAAEVTDPAAHMLDMGFDFDHVAVDQENGKWNRIPLNLPKLKRILNEWQIGLAERGWNSLYWCNHDQPRVVSRFGNDGRYRVLSAKALATTLHMLRGTPYIYQGEEIGMTNYPFKSMAEYRDLEVLNHYKLVVDNGGDLEAVQRGYAFFGRDNARTPMQWDSSTQAGFTTGTPWISVNPNSSEINASAATSEPNSVFHHYQELIQLRHSDPVIVIGDYELLNADDAHVYSFVRRLGDEGLLLLANWSDEVQVAQVPAAYVRDTRVISQNYPDAPPLSNEVSLRPWEAVVYRW